MTDKGKIGSAGSEQNFESVFREYFKPLVYYAVKLVHDQDSAKEIVHTVFIRLWEKREEIDMESSLRSYLFTAVHNRALNFLRDRSRFHGEDISEIGYGKEIGDEFRDRISEAETENRVISAIESLPERCREIFRLSRFEELKYREIAEKLKISVKTVEIQMSKALKILREELKDYLPLLGLWLIYFLFKNL